MEAVRTCPDVRYWSEVLCCTILTHMSDLEVKAICLEKTKSNQFCYVPFIYP